MVGEEGRAQVTRGTGRQRKRQTKPHPYPFFPLGVYGLPHIYSKTISGSDASRRRCPEPLLLIPILFRSHRHPPPLLVKEVLQS